MGKDDKPCRAIAFLLARLVPRYEDVPELLPFLSCPLLFFQKIIHLEIVLQLLTSALLQEIFQTQT